MAELFSILCFDHLEFYVGNARQAASFYETFFQFTNIAYRGLETGSRKVASYVMQQGAIRLVLSTALNSDHPIAQSVLKHGDHVAVIAVQVPNVTDAYQHVTARGAIAAIPPTLAEDETGILHYAAIHIYGDVLLKFVDRQNYRGIFAPQFQARHSALPNHDAGLQTIDHIVGNVEQGEMEHWVNFFADTMGFQLLVGFDDAAISTEYSALMSKVVQDGSGKIKLPINEPALRKGKSQIQEYLEFHQGAGVQHIAYSTHNIVETVTKLKQSGVEFLNVPRSYYEDLETRVGKINESIDRLAELGILVDRDQEGYLLQIFTQPVEDRPTLFFEIIERHGAQSFGEGNFKALFEAIEREQALRGNL
ncbi:MAG: 4-hydroxyphenylpyruvate dioxygenase [Leptolyngbya sp. UWPOB_LEPTO1]|uniref:4-hydroxyphenylpyruvate dioxygenase n=1 Tax=Leptolyngbya sp. UWPOB_LEPTO1 TaxID=2815653 RepID=UPI001AC1CEA8|nr:4-hydroxyphenylpyruvate dioxygenase [Leptolyngbya sp. UWPOB_LEPTO1]MBN8558989.1 4-hydroxyphenylpyruvate dioxygenase [Leptolyngbya sp. UWPOB_LEPTO1]